MVDESYYGHSTDELVSQFAGVRSTGATNMVAKRGVREVAEECGFTELVDFCEQATGEEYMAVLEEMGERR